MGNKTIEQNQRALVASFSTIDHWEERYREIIRLGRELAPFPEEHRTTKNKVKGCQSQVWMHAELRDGRVEYVADSDAAIVRGLIALIVKVYSGQPPAAILEAPPSFIDDLGLSGRLSQNRANGLASMIKQMKLYAAAFQTLEARKGDKPATA